MNRIKFCIRTCDILCHSCCNAWLSWTNDWGAIWRWRTRLSNSSQRCSRGFKSVEGHANTLMLLWVRKSMVTLAVWDRVLSCWNISLCRWITLSICGCKILYLLRWTRIRLVLLLLSIASLEKKNVIHCWTKFGASSSKSRPSMHDTNEHVHVCVHWLKLVQFNVLLADVRVGEA